MDGDGVERRERSEWSCLPNTNTRVDIAFLGVE